MSPLKILLLSCCLFPFPKSETRQISAEIRGKIDDFVENVFLPYSDATGLGLTVVQANSGTGVPEEILYTTGYGYGDHEKMEKNGNRTQFLLGSVTKTFTTLVVVKVLHECFPELGEVVLDTPIRQLLPQANFTLFDRFRTEHATFRDLLSHRMCIPRDDFQLMSEPFSTTAEIIYRQRYAEESCGFRTQFMYNNHMVLYASELIGILKKKSFVSIAVELLTEIGMGDSCFVQRVELITTAEHCKQRSGITLRAKPYYIKDNRSYPMNPEMMRRLANLPAVGGLYVTPEDMARFLSFQLNAGMIDGKQVIPEQVMSWLTKPSIVYPKFSFKGIPDDEEDTMELIYSPLAYGLGLMIGSYNGWEKYSHNGYFTPYRSEISWYPALHIGIFSATHEAPTAVKQQVLHTFIFDTLRGNKNAYATALRSLQGQKTKSEQDRLGTTQVVREFLGHSKNLGNSSTNPKPDGIWQEIVGSYNNRVSGSVEISHRIKQGQPSLYLSYGKWAKGWLEHVGGDTFQVTWDTDLVQDFYASGDEDGLGYVRLKQNRILEFLRHTPTGMIAYAQFTKDI